MRSFKCRCKIKSHYFQLYPQVVQEFKQILLQVSANELSRRLKEGPNITVNSVHPGIIMTDLMRHSFWQMRILKLFTYFIWKNAPQGAATTCYVAVHQGLKGVSGKYFADCNEYPASKFATDPELAKKLWDYSINLVNSLQR